mmetsp:Transcript_13808/g.42534  ORF Transcript_13808/g.42534 Transcript_13808/m.42534 type:complete len:84 (-) Transcript_13808:9-260(-)
MHLWQNPLALGQSYRPRGGRPACLCLEKARAFYEPREVPSEAAADSAVAVLGKLGAELFAAPRLQRSRRQGPRLRAGVAWGDM